MIDEQEGQPVHALDCKRRGKAQEQLVARLPPELQEERARCERARDDHPEQKSFKHGQSLSKIKPYSNSSMEAAATLSRHVYRLMAGTIERSTNRIAFETVKPAKHKPLHSSRRWRTLA